MARLLYHPLPDWFCTRELGTLHPFAQSILFCLVRHRNNDTGLCNPSTFTIARECGMSENSVTKFTRQLVAARVVETQKVFVSKRTSRYGKMYRAFRLEYKILIPLDDPQKELRDEIRKVNARVDRLTFDFSKLSQDLQAYAEYLRPVGKVGNVWQFETSTDLAASFVQDEFKKKAGVKIQILRKVS